jgi:uncharacterized membrane protein YgcG
MKTIFLFIAVCISGFWYSPVFSQTDSDTTSLGLPGDNLDLYAVLELFQKSKTIEEFEKSLNTEKTGINNLDLNLDKKVDFIKVETKQNDKDFTFILQVDVTDKEKQDVAVILVSKDKNDKVTMQIVGDIDLYGKDYIIEPKPAAPAATANPGYTGTETVIVTTPAPTTTVVVVESAPIVQYVYSPVYVPYYPPAYPPPYFTAFAVVAISVYHHNNYYYHSGYHGGYNNNTVVVHNTNNYNNYNNSRNSSNTVNHNNVNGKYNGNGSANTNNKAGNTSVNSNNKVGKTSGNKTSVSPSTKPTTSSVSPGKSSKKSRSSNPSTSSSGRSGRSGGGRSGGRR